MATSAGKYVIIQIKAKYENAQKGIGKLEVENEKLKNS